MTEAEQRERFEDRHRLNWGAAADLTRQDDGEYEDRLAQYEWVEWQAAYAQGRADGLEEAATMFDKHGESEKHTIWTTASIGDAIRALKEG